MELAIRVVVISVVIIIVVFGIALAFQNFNSGSASLIDQFYGFLGNLGKGFGLSLGE